MSSKRRTEVIADTLLTLIDKLAGKGSNLKLEFQNLNLDAGLLKATLNGAIILDVQYIGDKE